MTKFDQCLNDLLTYLWGLADINDNFDKKGRLKEEYYFESDDFDYASILQASDINDDPCFDDADELFPAEDVLTSLSAEKVHKIFDCHYGPSVVSEVIEYVNMRNKNCGKGLIE